MKFGRVGRPFRKSFSRTATATESETRMTDVHIQLLNKTSVRPGEQIGMVMDASILWKIWTTTTTWFRTRKTFALVRCHRRRAWTCMDAHRAKEDLSRLVNTATGRSFWRLLLKCWLV